MTVAEPNLDAIEKRALELLPAEVRADFEKLNSDERKLFLSAISDPEVLPLLYSVDFKEIPVSAEEFFSNPYYIGKDLVWDPKEHRGIYPIWFNELCHVLDPKNNITEWILSGSLGSGKSTASMCALMYQVYWLNCLRDPHAYLGMLPSSPIELFLFSITLTTVEDAGVARFERLISGSPYFRERFPVNRRRRMRGRRGSNDDFDYKLEFPPFLEITEGSRSTHFISRDILGGMLDEANFIPQPKRSGALSYDSTSKAFQLYQSLKNRIESRFMKQGRTLGLMCMISSAATRFDFLEQHKKKQRNNPRVHISEFALYDIKPWEYGGEKFRVLIGTDQSNSRILGANEKVDSSELSERVIEVPVEHREAYERDLSQALRDISGVPSEVVSPLIPSRELIAASVDESRHHPFTVESPTISHLNETQLDSFLVPQHLVKWRGNKLVPKHHPDSLRHIHVDLSKTQCATGISMGCVAGYQEIARTGKDGRNVKSRSPIIWFDFTLQIVPPPPPGEIDYSKIRHFLKYLRDSLNFNIGTVSFDGFQSVDSRQILLKMGFLNVEILSVDKTIAPYMSLRSAIMEKRVVRPPYQPLDRELVSLRLIQEGEKAWVERGEGELKDTSDSACGVIHWCNEEAARDTASETEVQRKVVEENRNQPLPPITA